MRWIWAVLAVAVIAILAIFTNRNSPDQVVNAVPTTQEDVAMAEKSERADEAIQNYASAPAPVQALAVSIYTGEPLSADILTQASPEMLSTMYIEATPTAGQRNLLLDAFGFDRLDAAHQLVEAGADVNVANSLIARGAITKIEGTRMIPFPDFSPGLPWLQLYAENGGDMNAQEQDGHQTLLMRAMSAPNLEALLYLLENGADGWKAPATADWTSRPFFERLAQACAGIETSEMLFRVAKAGHLQGSTDEQFSIIFRELEAAFSGFDGTGPSHRAIRWRIRQIALAIAENSEATIPSGFQALLDKDAENDAGGWHLGPDMVRSPPEDELTEPLEGGARKWPE